MSGVWSRNKLSVIQRCPCYRGVREERFDNITFGLFGTKAELTVSNRGRGQKQNPILLTDFAEPSQSNLPI